MRARTWNVTIDMEGMARYGISVRAGSPDDAISQAWERWSMKVDHPRRKLEESGEVQVIATPVN